MANPYNLGFGFYGGHDCDTVMKLVKASEDNDFASVWIAEDYFYGGAFSTAAACAVQTSKIQIGTGGDYNNLDALVFYLVNDQIDHDKE